MGIPADPSKRAAKSKAPSSKAPVAKATTAKAQTSPKPRKTTRRVTPAAANGAELAPTSAEQRHQRIAVTAYYLAQARGFEPGHEQEDWFAAERLIDAGAVD